MNNIKEFFLEMQQSNTNNAIITKQDLEYIKQCKKLLYLPWI